TAVETLPPVAYRSGSKLLVARCGIRRIKNCKAVTQSLALFDEVHLDGEDVFVRENRRHITYRFWRRNRRRLNIQRKTRVRDAWRKWRDGWNQLRTNVDIRYRNDRYFVDSVEGGYSSQFHSSRII